MVTPPVTYIERGINLSSTDCAAGWLCPGRLFLTISEVQIIETGVPMRYVIYTRHYRTSYTEDNHSDSINQYK